MKRSALPSPPMSTDAFRRVFAAEVISTFGSLMSRLAIPWMAVLVLRAEPTAMALLALADVAASALAALLVGALVDRWPKRRTMIAADLARAAMLATVPLAAAVDALSIGWLVIVVAVNGALSVAFELAQSAWIARSTAQRATDAAQFGARRWRGRHRGRLVRPHRMDVSVAGSNRRDGGRRGHLRRLRSAAEQSHRTAAAGDRDHGDVNAA